MMKMLSYAPEPVLVGDATADDLIAYAAMLASLRLTTTVRLDVLTLAGRPATAEILLAPTTHLMTLTHECHYAEPDNEARRAAMRDARRAVMREEMPVGADVLMPRAQRIDSIFDETDFDLLEAHQPYRF